MKRLRGSSLFAVVAALTVVFGARAAEAGLFGHKHAAQPISPSSHVLQSGSTGGLMRTIDAERARDHAPALALDARISRVAQAYANDMARRNFFGHVSPDGVDTRTRMRNGGLVMHAGGENIGLGRDLAGAERAIYGDPAHRAIVLDARFHHIGLGTARSRSGVILVEDFTD